jgi:hypothetical protein
MTFVFKIVMFSQLEEQRVNKSLSKEGKGLFLR